VAAKGVSILGRLYRWLRPKIPIDFSSRIYVYSLLVGVIFGLAVVLSPYGLNTMRFFLWKNLAGFPLLLAEGGSTLHYVYEQGLHAHRTWLLVLLPASGGSVGIVGQQFFPELVPQPAAFVVVGMASFFAGLANAPLGALILVTEMTDSYHLLPPLMLVCFFVLVCGQQFSIYKNQVPNKFHSPAHI
jgi:hypothetical protein